jgi:hypothetical protein
LPLRNTDDAFAIGCDPGPMTGNASIPAIGPFCFINLQSAGNTEKQIETSL